jgi:transcriptional repressor NrdR
MKCPYCGESETKVVDSREIDEQTRRRRECDNCEKRFTTYERVESLGIVVIKKNGSKESFDKEKIRKGVLNACAKRPVTLEQIDGLVEDVAFKVMSWKSLEVPGTKIGQTIMKKLAKLDGVAYLRFASVYKDFSDVKDFKEEIKVIQKR